MRDVGSLRSTVGIVVTTVALGVGVSACSAGAPAPAPITVPPGSQRVNVTESEWTVRPATSTVRAGSITFVVHNAGLLTHELVLLRTVQQVSALPSRPGNLGKIVENGFGISHVAEIAHLPPGATRTLTVRLSPGHYALVCDKQGHYESGMQASLDVSQG